MSNAANRADSDLVGRLGKILVDQLASQREMWHKLNETEQHVALDRLEQAVAEAVADTVDFIASRGFEHARLHLEQVTFKGPQVKVAASCGKRHPHAHDLADLSGGDVILVLANANDFLQSDSFPLPDKDQAELDLDDEIVWSVDDRVSVPVGDVTQNGRIVRFLDNDAEVRLDAAEGDDTIIISGTMLAPPVLEEEDDAPLEEGDIVKLEGDVIGTIIELDAGNATVEYEDLEGNPVSEVFDVATLSRAPSILLEG